MNLYLPWEPGQVTPERKLRGYMVLTHTKGMAQRQREAWFPDIYSRSTTKLSTALHP